MSRSQMEEDRLAEVAMEYRAKGYEVHLEPDKTTCRPSSEVLTSTSSQTLRPIT